MTRVLIVDDEPPVRELMTRWLEPDGYALEQAADGAAALEVVRKGGIDVVVTDVAMPGQDGLWLLANVRAEFPDVAVVLATAVDEIPGTVTLQPGVLGYLLKPLTGEKVRAAVKRAVQWRTAALAAPAADPARVHPLDEWLKGRRR